MSKTFYGIVLFIMLVVLPLSVIGTMWYIKNNNKIDALSETIAQQKKDIEANEKKSLAEIQGKQETIDYLMGQVDSANTVIEGLKEKQAVKDAHINGLNARLSWAKTDAERVPILTGLVEQWTGKYELVSIENKELRSQVVNLKLAIAEQTDISESYKKLWQDEKALRLNTELKLGIVEKRMKKNKLITYGAIGASIFLVAVSK